MVVDVKVDTVHQVPQSLLTKYSLDLAEDGFNRVHVGHVGDVEYWQDLQLFVEPHGLRRLMHVQIVHEQCECLPVHLLAEPPDVR